MSDVLEFMRAVWSLDHGLQAASKRMHKALGVTGAQRLAIRIIGRFPALSAARLAEVLHLDPSTLSGILKRLEEQGFVERELDSTDRRRVMLRLTKKGLRVNRSTKGTVEETMRKTLATFPAGRVAAASDVVKAIAKALRPSRAPVPRRPQVG
ncbi:MAG: MarR family transcriptional regulator [Thermoanaerobaculia bacterium]